MSDPFATRYGPWALVAGASEGLGAAFAHALGARGLSLLLVARRPGPLEAVAREVAARHGVEARALPLDLASPDLPAAVAAATADLEVGLLVYNAAFAPRGPLLDRPMADALLAVDVSCRGPLVLAHTLGRPMVARGRGGVVLMSSLAGLQGSPTLATYAATKAFGRVLAEGLWDELRGAGVDVVASVAGATRTPGYEASEPRGGGRPMAPEAVVRDALDALGRRPVTIPGAGNRAAAAVLGRLLPRRAAVALMGRTLRRLYPALPGPEG